MELLLELNHQLNQQQLQNLELLQLSSLELEQFLQELALENPMVELELPVAEDTSFFAPRPSHSEWLAAHDEQNPYYHRFSQNAEDPLSQAGTSGGLEDSLPRFLLSQLQQLHLNNTDQHLIHYLILCLDDDGYLRQSLSDLAAEQNVPLSRMANALNLLRSFEPAGVAACSLAECLELQLLRMGYTGPALAIVRHHLYALSRNHYHDIAKKLSVPLKEVYQALALIRTLNPKPGSLFLSSEPVSYLFPDIFIFESEGGFVAQARKKQTPSISISPGYRKILTQSADEQTIQYLSEKLRQAQTVLDGIQRREQTILRCAQVIADRQQSFFQLGPRGLVPLRMSEVAEELGIHESTVSRAIREKYLQCSHGVFPLRYFFNRSSSAPCQADFEISSCAAKEQLKTLILQEDKQHPLSDQQLAQQLAQSGYPISRRTVAKYRDELNIPGTFGRKNHS